MKNKKEKIVEEQVSGNDVFKVTLEDFPPGWFRDITYHCNNPEQKKKAKFALGRIVATPGAVKVLETANQDPMEFIMRHEAGDWSEIPYPEDREMNDEAIAHDGDPKRMDRVLSVYKTLKGEELWIITEADRSVTTILLPKEY